MEDLPKELKKKLKTQRINVSEDLFSFTLPSDDVKKSLQ